MTISFDQAYTKRSVLQDPEVYEFEATFIVRTDTPGEIVDEGTVRIFALTDMPLVVDGVPRNAITAIERINDDNYRVKLAYVTTDPQDEEEEAVENGPTDSFNTTGGREHITYGIERVTAAGPALSSELGAVINYDGDTVNGVDITIPRFGFTKTVKVPASLVTDTFVRTIHDLTGSINDSPFGIFNPKEVLFLGAVGSRTFTNDDIEDEWEITYHFEGQKSRFGIQFNKGLPDAFDIFEKAGWDYIWVQYEDKEDEGQEKIIQKPIAAYVIKVYPSEFFGRLGFI